MLCRSPPLRWALAGFVACAACQPVSAAEWSLQPTVSWISDHDSNRRLSVTRKEADEGAWLTLDASLKRATETSEITLQPHVQLQRFSGDAELDSNDGSLLLSGIERLERWTVSGSAQYSRDSTLTTELFDTGIIDTASRREARAGSFSVSRLLTERQALQGSASYSDVTFPGGLRFGLVGYRYPSVALTYSFSYTSRLTFSATGFGSQSTAPVVHYESRDAGARLGIEYSFSERTKLSISAGMDESHVNGAADTGTVWAIRATRDAERTQWSLSYDHSVQPSGSGTLVLRDAAILSATRGVAPTLYATASLTNIRNADLGSQLQYDRQYFAGDLGLEWRASPQWRWSVTGGMSQSRLPRSNETARGWRTGLHMLWLPLAWSESR
jgi:hypothetical protein